MTPVERLHAHSKTRFDMRRNNCAHAAIAAFADNPTLARAYAVAMAQPGKPSILDRATAAAATCALPPAAPAGAAWGVCMDENGEQAICVRYAVTWWRRTARGVRKTADSQMIAAWGAY